MADRFLRYITGSDSNDGLTFAAPLKTISGTTALKANPGDRIKIEKSPDPQSTTQTATWTKGSRFVTLASALTGTKNISRCEVNWTVASGVTATAGTGTNRGDSTRGSAITIAAGAVTGKIAYMAVENGPIDLTGFTRLSFMTHIVTTTIAASALSIKLCTDTTGDTPVASFTFPGIATTNRWMNYTLDLGSSIGSGIQSIAIYMDVDIAPNQALHFDQFIACKPAGDAQAVDYHTLIGMSSDPLNLEWYRVRGFSQDMLTIELENCGSLSTPTAAQSRPYYGENYTGTLYKRETIVVAQTNTATAAAVTGFVVQFSGTEGLNLKFSGGWDPADSMATQNGLTIFSSEHVDGGYFFTMSSKNYLEFERLGATGFSQVWRVDACNYCLWHSLGFMGMNATGFVSLNANTNHVINDIGVYHHGISTSTFVSMYRCKVTAQPGNIWRSIGGGTQAIQISSCWDSLFDFEDLKVDNCNGVGLVVNACTRCVVGRMASVKENTGIGISLTGVNTDNTFLGCDDLASNGTYGLSLSANTANCRFYNFHSSGNVSGAILYNAYGDNYGYNYNMGDNETSGFTASLSGRFVSVKHDGTADNLKIQHGYGTIASDTSVVYGDAVRSIKCSPTSVSECTEMRPLEAFTWQHQVQAGMDYTFTVYARRDSSSVTCRLFVRKYQLDGIDQDYSATLSTTGSWAPITIGPITPTENGVIEIKGQCWGGTTNNGWFNQVSFTET